MQTRPLLYIVDQIQETTIYDKIKSTRREYVVQVAINAGIIDVKQYMTDSIYSSEILIRLIYNAEKIIEEFNLDFNRVIAAITYLSLFKRKTNTFIKVPDKKVAAILRTNKQICHKFLYFLSGILSVNPYKQVDNYSENYFEFTYDNKNNYFIYKFYFEDQFIKDIGLYFYKRQIQKFKFRISKVKKILKKYDQIPLSKLDKRKELYYYNTTCCEIEARNTFKKIVFGLSWWNTHLTENYYTPKALKQVRAACGQREDIYYVEAPLDLLSYVTGLTDYKIKARINTTISGMGILIQKHNYSYKNIENTSDIWSPVKKDIYNNYELLRHGKIKQESLTNEQYLASIQGFETTDTSYIINANYFNTTIGKFIMNNKNIFLYLLKDYYIDYLGNQKWKNKKEDNIKPFYKESRELLTKEQVQEILNSNLLKNIDLKNKELKKEVNKLINKDKIFGLPFIKPKRTRIYNYKSCMLKNKYHEIVKKTQAVRDPITDEVYTCNTIQFKDPIFCIKYIPKVIAQINNCNETCLNLEISEKDKKDLPANVDFITDCKTNYKQINNELGYWIKQLQLITEHVLQGFKKVGKALEKFLLEIKHNHLGTYFSSYSECEQFIMQII